MEKTGLKPLLHVTVLLLVIGQISCGQKTFERILNTPGHYVSSGFKLLEKKRIDDAKREFEYALQLAPEYSPAYRGMGLMSGLKGDFEKAEAWMGKAEFFAKSAEDKSLAHVGFMRLHMLKRGKGWIHEVERHFSSAIVDVKDLPEAYYVLGLALKQRYRFPESKRAFERVKKIHKGFIPEAEKELKTLATIESAMPLSPVGMSVAITDFVTRSEVAALFVHELKLIKIYRNFQLEGGKDRPPDNAEHREGIPHSMPIDIQGHRYMREIMEILPLKIQGLESDKHRAFHPDAFVTRAEYAQMIAHVMTKIRGEHDLLMSYREMSSPFHDIRKDAPYFGAVMFCTIHSRVMEAKNANFAPKARVSGADALFIMRKLKDNLGIILGSSFHSNRGNENDQNDVALSMDEIVRRGLGSPVFHSEFRADTFGCRRGPLNPGS